jgi:hypothetical protein
MVATCKNIKKEDGKNYPGHLYFFSNKGCAGFSSMTIDELLLLGGLY